MAQLHHTTLISHQALSCFVYFTQYDAFHQAFTWVTCMPKEASKSMDTTSCYALTRVPIHSLHCRCGSSRFCGYDLY
jgi:hypothetical protein